MAISYSDIRDKTDTPGFFALLVVNAALMLFFVLGWTAWADGLAEPLEWALTEVGSPRLNLLAYPYLVLWSLPLACCVISSLANRYEMALLARIAGIAPPLLLGLVFGWYYLAPLSWR